MSIAEDFNPKATYNKRERSIEGYLQRQVEKIGGRAYKFTSPGYDGMPDRIIHYRGVTVYVETKRPKNGKHGLLQKARADELRDLGIPAYTAWNRKEVDALIGLLLVMAKEKGANDHGV